MCKSKDFAQQINLNMDNCWGIVRALVDLCLNLDEGKYLLVKEPNKPIIRLYNVPGDSFTLEQVGCTSPMLGSWPWWLTFQQVLRICCWCGAFLAAAFHLGSGCRSCQHESLPMTSCSCLLSWLLQNYSEEPIQEDEEAPEADGGQEKVEDKDDE